MSKEFDDFMKIVASDEFREEKAEYIAKTISTVDGCDERVSAAYISEATTIFLLQSYHEWLSRP